MLVLSRRTDESLLVGEDVVITVLGVDGDRVKLGIRAPRSVTVLREEIFRQVQSANAAAASLPSRPFVESIASALRGRPADALLPGNGVQPAS